MQRRATASAPRPRGPTSASSVDSLNRPRHPRTCRSYEPLRLAARPALLRRTRDARRRNGRRRRVSPRDRMGRRRRHARPVTPASRAIRCLVATHRRRRRAGTRKAIGAHRSRGCSTCRPTRPPSAAHLAADPWFAPLVEAAPGPARARRVVRLRTGRARDRRPAGQREGGTTIIGRLVQRAGTAHRRSSARAIPPGASPRPPPSPPRTWTKIGMPGKRVAALQGFARAVASGALPLDDPRADRDELRAALLALPGIGPWTVEYVAMRAWRDADAWPAWDLILMQSHRGARSTLMRPTQQRAHGPKRGGHGARTRRMHLWNESGGPGRRRAGRIGGMLATTTRRAGASDRVRISWQSTPSKRPRKSHRRPLPAVASSRLVTEMLKCPLLENSAECCRPHMLALRVKRHMAADNVRLASMPNTTPSRTTDALPAPPVCADLPARSATR